MLEWRIFMFLRLISIFCGNALVVSLLMFLCMGLVECHPYEKNLGAKTFIIYFVLFFVNLIFCILWKSSFIPFLAGCFLGLITAEFYKIFIHKSWRSVKLSHIIVPTINFIIIILGFVYH